MADYYSPTVLQPDIPTTDMTDLERLLLTEVFQSEPDGDGLYFFAETAVNQMVTLETASVVEALAASEGVESPALSLVREALAASPSGAVWLDLDLTATVTWEHIVQDVVRRSATLDHVIATSAFTCSRMDPDGFGGMVVLITADQILAKSTDDMLGDLFDRVEHGEIGVAPGLGVHVLLGLAETDVRAEVVRLVAAEETLAGLAAEDVADSDIRAACAFVAARADLAKEQAAAISLAAREAIQAAKERQTPSV